MGSMGPYHYWVLWDPTTNGFYGTPPLVVRWDLWDPTSNGFYGTLPLMGSMGPYH
jgi:hypothetical protein